jgi:two-component system, cell cycle sensor histidine kinase and response regulator CckA
MNKRLRVLFLEDNPSDAKLIAHELRRAGFQLDWQRADSEERCRECLRPGLDLILADGSLPGFGAARALDLLRERNLDIPLIVVSGSLSDREALMVMEHGAADYLLKDRLARLGPAVHRVLERSRTTNDVRRGEQTSRSALESTPAADDFFESDGPRVSAMQDFSEKNSLEEQVRQSRKLEAIGQLVGGVAHDFNNMLTIINGYSSLVLQQMPAGDPLRSMIEQIHHAGERSAMLTHQLLAFSRQQVIEPQVLDLGSVIADTEKMLCRVIGEDIQLRMISEQPLWPVLADVGSVSQVMLNLAINARDAMQNGGTLTIEIKNHVASEMESARYVMLAVSDTGVGMDDVTKARIFEPFFTTKGTQGTGLGLATVQAIMQQVNGYITIESAPGRGATFKLYFPVATEASCYEDLTRQQESSAGGLETILLVEDDEGVRTLARHVLADCGYTLLQASNGRAAIKLAELTRTRIHLLVTDVVMPELGGRELADQVVALHPETRVLYLSGYTDDAIVRTGIHQTQVALLHKPFTPSVLASRIREILDQ